MSDSKITQRTLFQMSDAALLNLLQELRGECDELLCQLMESRTRRQAAACHLASFRDALKEELDSEIVTTQKTNNVALDDKFSVYAERTVRRDKSEDYFVTVTSCEGGYRSVNRSGCRSGSSCSATLFQDILLASSSASDKTIMDRLRKDRVIRIAMEVCEHVDAHDNDEEEDD